MIAVGGIVIEEGRYVDDRLYFCSHCEEDLFVEVFINHMGHCIARHMERWPIHPPGNSYCPELCGKPHRRISLDQPF
jgi:hypothetical protein